MVVVDVGPLELDEQDLVVDRGAALLGPCEQRARFRIGGVDREAQVRVVAGASGELTDRGQLGHQLGQSGRVEVGDPAAVLLRDPVGTGRGVVEQSIDARGARAVDERLDVPRDLSRGSVGVSEGHRPRL